MKRENNRHVAQMRATASVRKTKASQATKPIRAKTSRDKVRTHRKRMRAKGMRLMQMWVPDTRTADFAKEARRQARLANRTAHAAADQAWVDAISDRTLD